jgi:hypothetical protein
MLFILKTSFLGDNINYSSDPTTKFRSNLRKGSTFGQAKRAQKEYFFARCSKVLLFAVSSFERYTGLTGAAPKSSIFRKTTIFGRKIPPKTSSFAKDTTFGCAKLVSFSKLLFLDAQN